MESDVLKQRWDEIRQQARRWWVKLTDKDLQDIKGDRSKLIALLQMRHGYSRRQAERELDRRLNDYIRFVR